MEGKRARDSSSNPTSKDMEELLQLLEKLEGEKYVLKRDRKLGLYRCTLAVDRHLIWLKNQLEDIRHKIYLASINDICSTYNQLPFSIPNGGRMKRYRHGCDDDSTDPMLE